MSFQIHAGLVRKPLASYYLGIFVRVIQDNILLPLSYLDHHIRTLWGWIPRLDKFKALTANTATASLSRRRGLHMEGRNNDSRESPHGNATHNNPKRKLNSAAVGPPDRRTQRQNSKIQDSNENQDNITCLQNQNHAHKKCEGAVLQRGAKHRPLEEEYRNLERSLRECREQIFSLQPVESTTEQQIREQYDSLCKSIQNWVKAGFLCSDDFVESFVKANFEAERNALARELLSVLCDGISQETLGLYPLTAVNFLCCLVQRHLDRRVLNVGNTFPGLDKSLCDAIEHIGDGIRDLRRPQRGE
jgi:hypothetical protein